MKTKRSRATDITQKTRQEVLKRDGYRCIICGKTNALTIAHALSRAKGGRGIKENLATLCMQCHHVADNGFNKKMRSLFNEYLNIYLDKIYGVERKKNVKYKCF